MRWPASVRETRGSHPAVQAVRSRACPHKGAAPGARNTGAVPPRCWRAGVSGLPPERPGSGGRTEQASNTARGTPKVRRTCGRHDRIAALTSGDHAPASRDAGARGSETGPGVPRALEPGADGLPPTRKPCAGMRTAAWMIRSQRVSCSLFENRIWLNKRSWTQRQTLLWRTSANLLRCHRRACPGDPGKAGKPSPQALASIIGRAGT